MEVIVEALVEVRVEGADEVLESSWKSGTGGRVLSNLNGGGETVQDEAAQLSG